MILISHIINENRQIINREKEHNVFNVVSAPFLITSRMLLFREYKISQRTEDGKNPKELI